MNVLGGITILALAVFSLWIPPGQAAETTERPPSPACSLSPETCSLFQSAADELGVPIRLTQAIAEVESAVTPYALNIEGKAFFFDDKEKAIEMARRALDQGKSFDSGIMQINSQWVKHFNLPLEAMFDPEANIYLGSWILSKNIHQYPGWQAVARYHSTDESRGRAYVEQVKTALRKTEDRNGKTKPRVSAPGSGKLAASLVKDILPVPNEDESKEKIVPDAGGAESGFVRDTAPQNHLAGRLVVYRNLAAGLAVGEERKSAAHASPSLSVREKEKAPVFVQRFDGVQTPIFARQARNE